MRTTDTTPGPPPPTAEFAAWLASARRGSQADLGRALDACRAYLTMVAEAELGSTLRQKAGASDLVQDSLADALAGFGQFRGATRDEFVAWVGQILRRNLADLGRRYRGAECRAVDREEPFDSGRPPAAVSDGASGPDTAAARAEEVGRLRVAVARLPTEARLVVTWRHQDGLGWAEIGDRLGKTADAARMTYFRAVERLRAELGRDHDAAG